MKAIYMILFPLSFLFVYTGAHAQEKDHMFRQARLVIDSAQLERYLELLKEEIQTSLQVEPGVLTLYAVAEKDKPNHITIIEIYKNSDAYQSHIQTPHFLKYKTATGAMVLSLELIEMVPLLPELKLRQKRKSKK